MFVLNISLKSIFQRKCHNRALVSVGLADGADRSMSSELIIQSSLSYVSVT